MAAFKQIHQSEGKCESGGPVSKVTRGRSDSEPYQGRKQEAVEVAVPGGVYIAVKIKKKWKVLPRTLGLTHIGKTREGIETDNWEASLDIQDLGCLPAIPIEKSREQPSSTFASPSARAQWPSTRE